MLNYLTEKVLKKMWPRMFTFCIGYVSTAKLVSPGCINRLNIFKPLPIETVQQLRSLSSLWWRSTRQQICISELQSVEKLVDAFLAAVQELEPQAGAQLLQLWDRISTKQQPEVWHSCLELHLISPQNTVFRDCSEERFPVCAYGL